MNSKMRVRGRIDSAFEDKVIFILSLLLSLAAVKIALM